MSRPHCLSKATNHGHQFKMETDNVRFHLWISTPSTSQPPAFGPIQKVNGPRLRAATSRAHSRSLCPLTLTPSCTGLHT